MRSFRMVRPRTEVKESGLLAGYGAEPHIQLPPKGCAPLGIPARGSIPWTGVASGTLGNARGAGRQGVLTPARGFAAGGVFNIFN
jgi:hypothetical protein